MKWTNNNILSTIAVLSIAQMSLRELRRLQSCGLFRCYKFSLHKLISLEHQCLPFYSLFTCVPVCIFIDQCLKSSLMKECLNGICKAETNQSYKRQYVLVIDLVLGQDGWILAILFLRVYGPRWTETGSKSINSQKNNKAIIHPSWPNKLGQ